MKVIMKKIIKSVMGASLLAMVLFQVAQAAPCDCSDSASCTKQLQLNCLSTAHPDQAIAIAQGLHDKIAAQIYKKAMTATGGSSKSQLGAQLPGISTTNTTKPNKSASPSKDAHWWTN